MYIYSLKHNIIKSSLLGGLEIQQYIDYFSVEIAYYNFSNTYLYESEQKQWVLLSLALKLN